MARAVFNRAIQSVQWTAVVVSAVDGGCRDFGSRLEILF
jgi:hypothetical protein